MIMNERYRRVLSNKYFLSVGIFFIWLLFLEETNIFSLYKYRQQIKIHQEAIDNYERDILMTKQSIEELKDPVLLEKFARENYIMKKDDEDIYIIKSSIN